MVAPTAGPAMTAAPQPNRTRVKVPMNSASILFMNGAPQQNQSARGIVARLIGIYGRWAAYFWIKAEAAVSTDSVAMKRLPQALRDMSEAHSPFDRSLPT